MSSRNFREDMAWTGDVKYHAGAHARDQGRRARWTWSSRCRRTRATSRRSIRSSRAWRARPAPIVDAPGAPTFDPARSAADPDSRRRGVPRPGHRRRDAEPEPAARLRHRRHDPHHRQQPARVHGRRRASRTARRYASGLARGFKIPIVHVNADDPEACVEAARLAFAYRAALPARLPDRPDRLPALRPQRGRRAGVHAAADVPEDRRAPDRARDLGARRSSSAASIDAGARRRARQEAHRRAAAGARRRCKPEQDFVEPQPEPPPPGAAAQGRDRGAARAAARAERRAADAARRLHGPPEARARAREAARTMLDAAGRAHASTGPPPRSWRSRRSSPTASASG